MSRFALCSSSAATRAGRPTSAAIVISASTASTAAARFHRRHSRSMRAPSSVLRSSSMSKTVAWGSAPCRCASSARTTSPMSAQAATAIRMAHGHRQCSMSAPPFHEIPYPAGRGVHAGVARLGVRRGVGELRRVQRRDRQTQSVPVRRRATRRAPFEFAQCARRKRATAVRGGELACQRGKVRVGLIGCDRTGVVLTHHIVHAREPLLRGSGLRVRACRSGGRTAGHTTSSPRHTRPPRPRPRRAPSTAWAYRRAWRTGAGRRHQAQSRSRALLSLARRRAQHGGGARRAETTE